MVTIEGRVWWRGDEGYEEARQAAVWNLLKPDRYPEVIVRPTGDQDVVAAVRLARERGLKVKARGGGHSWTASAVRDGMLIDFTDFKQITIDADACTATVTPSVMGMELIEALAPHGLFFPGGHCSGVGLGGYLLQGGFGWNGRALGPACASVRAIDVVTAEGELIHSDDTTNPDFIWAARGSGPGFFGVVTRFHLKVHPLPAALFVSTYAYPLEVFDEVIPWFLETSASLPAAVEPLLFTTEPPGAGPLMGVSGVSFLESEPKARDALALLETCPALERATTRRTMIPTSTPELNALGATPMSFRGLHGPGSTGTAPLYRHCVDGMWTDAAPADLTRELRELFETMPTPESSVLLTPWREMEVRNGVFSMQASLYVSPVAAWTDLRDDERCTAWATGQMRRLEPLSKGIQLADENLINRLAPFMAPDKLERLERLRATYDPDGLFHSYLMRDA
jgi:hypothetical protein